MFLIVMKTISVQNNNGLWFDWFFLFILILGEILDKFI